MYMKNKKLRLLPGYEDVRIGIHSETYNVCLITMSLITGKEQYIQLPGKEN